MCHAGGTCPPLVISRSYQKVGLIYCSLYVFGVRLGFDRYLDINRVSNLGRSPKMVTPSSTSRNFFLSRLWSSSKSKFEHKKGTQRGHPLIITHNFFFENLFSSKPLLFRFLDLGRCPKMVTPSSTSQMIFLLSHFVQTLN
jgi:hypothetical protein